MRTVRNSLVVLALASASFTSFAASAQDFRDRWPAPEAGASAPAEKPAEPSRIDKPDRSEGLVPQQQSETSKQSSYDANARLANKTFSGRASFYSYRHGKTASGSNFNRDEPTAAHRTLPFGTKVRVTNVKNNKEVVVTITDRGPNKAGRVLDLSLSAARSLEITNRGIAQIRAEVL